MDSEATGRRKMYDDSIFKSCEGFHPLGHECQKAWVDVVDRRNPARLDRRGKGATKRGIKRINE